VVKGEIYVTGGKGNENNRLSSVEKYSPSTDTWSSVNPMPAARASHAAVAVGSVMYVLRGYEDGEDEDATASMLKFDSTQGTWSQLAPMPMASWGIAACVVESDIFVFGGTDDTQDYQDSVFKFDTVTNAWSSLAPMPQACSHVGVCVLDGLVYIVGVGGHYCDVLRFNPMSNEWTTRAPISFGTSRYRTIFAAEGYLYAVAGNAERYDVASDTWTAVADVLDPVRIFAGAVTITSVGPAEEQDLLDSLIVKASRRLQ
jgi:N-acetylneuraminic acid mutarotase